METIETIFLVSEDLFLLRVAMGAKVLHLVHLFAPFLLFVHKPYFRGICSKKLLHGICQFKYLYSR